MSRATYWDTHQAIQARRLRYSASFYLDGPAGGPTLNQALAAAGLRKSRHAIVRGDSPVMPLRPADEVWRRFARDRVTGRLTWPAFAIESDGVLVTECELPDRKGVRS